MSQQRTNHAVDEVFALYEKHGTENYIGEKVSQIEHMCQAAQLAEKAGYGPEVIMAAFFHDIGHLVEQHGRQSMGGYGVKEHEKIGADYLRKKGFPEKVAALVQSHVQAKRYLTYKDDAYYNALSEASRLTLEYQGGRMTWDEAQEFEKQPLFKEMVQLRLWDDEAKVQNRPLPSINRYKQMAAQLLSEGHS